MPSNGLIVIVRVRPECQDRLRRILKQIGNDINGRQLVGNDQRPHIDFPSSRTIHFARLVLLSDPDCGPGRKRLLLVTDYEGPWINHVRELYSLTSNPEAIWGCCEGYSDSSTRFTSFIRRHMVKPQAYYIAFHGLSLQKIRAFEKCLKKSGSFPVKKPAPSLPDIALQGLEDLARLPLIGLNVLGIVLRRGPLGALRAARRVNATLDRIWWIYIFNRLTLNKFPPPDFRHSSIPVDTTKDCEPASPQDEVTSKLDWEGVPTENLVAQNQLTLVTAVRPEMLPQLQAVLEVIDLYAKRLAEEGSLVGINTIHTVRWTLLDGGKRLLMASNYDGTWESYIDEFAEMILSGLYAIWESSYGFPVLGAQDLAAFKYFLRCHQAPASVFYSAYPSTTIPNILGGLQSELARSLK